MATSNPGGRPRKYASDAEKRAAYRERWASLNVRCEQRTKETVAKLAAVADCSEADIVNAAVKFYALNFDQWRDGLIFGGRLPTLHDAAYRAKVKRAAENAALLAGDDDGE